MSKTLIKLVDEAIIPSLLLVLAKVGGLYLSAVLLELEFDILKTDGAKLSPFSIAFQSQTDLMLANALSNFAMVTIAGTGFVYILYKIAQFQDKRITPTKLIRLADRGLLSLIESSYNVYLKAFVWIIFLWIAVILSTISVFSGDAQVWSAVISILFGLISTLFLVKNIEIDYTKFSTQT